MSNQKTQPVIEAAFSAARSLNFMAFWLRAAAKALKLDHIGWTCHSPRAGRASDLLPQNAPYLQIREEGRWVSDSSLRRYLDVVAVMAGEASKALAPFLPMVMVLENNFVNAFHWW